MIHENRNLVLKKLAYLRCLKALRRRLPAKRVLPHCRPAHVIWGKGSSAPRRATQQKTEQEMNFPGMRGRGDPLHIH